jgi:hypothetical protein
MNDKFWRNKIERCPRSETKGTAAALRGVRNPCDAVNFGQSFQRCYNKNVETLHAQERNNE